MYLQDSEVSIEVHVHTPSAGRPGGIWRGGGGGGTLHRSM